MKFNHMLIALAMSAVVAPSAMAKGGPVGHKPVRTAPVAKKIASGQLRRSSGKVAKKAPKAPKLKIQE